MSLFDNATHRAGFQARLILLIRTIDDFRNEIMIARHGRRGVPAALLGQADFHLAEAQDELRRASSRIGAIDSQP
jgi:hypothetical protein